MALADQRKIAALTTRRQSRENEAYGIRSRDLLDAIEALYQLS
jgi:hypothetical protein